MKVKEITQEQVTAAVERWNDDLGFNAPFPLALEMAGSTGIADRRIKGLLENTDVLDGLPIEHDEQREGDMYAGMCLGIRFGLYIAEANDNNTKLVVLKRTAPEKRRINWPELLR